MIIPNLHEGRDSEGLVSRAVQEISSSGAAKSASARFSHLMARYLALRADDDEKTDAECHPQPNVDLCEKQSAASHIDIIVPVCIGAALLIGLLATLCYLNMKRKKRDEAEWSSKNNHEMEDYGIEARPSRR
ncbi:hypothetical protein MGN70_008705 [Eutypa lata]|uniref:Uncharacterized protein n=1 Tax=Eutypa lata (strain UCR-EL1) TaxID=1287681 RepID=M7T842_EUTLA|nr:hypothetical protein UCREL1_122 [Eutypa lata UCREL1]KAI1249097.1 hypothetical protein MGN70_008705 [Eutypa lata]